VQEAPQLYHFASYRGHDASTIAKRLLAIPEAERCIHAVFGRSRMPVDFFCDVDLPLFNPAAAQAASIVAAAAASPGDAAAEQAADGIDLGEPTAAAKKPYTGESIVMDVVAAANDLLLRHLGAAASQVVVLDGSGPGGAEAAGKFSYHVHMRCDGAAFSDYRSVGEVASEINQRIGVQALDLGIYRPNGMLRTAFTTKYSARERVLRRMEARDTGLQQLLAPMHKEMDDTHVLGMSLVARTDEFAAHVRDGKDGQAPLRLADVVPRKSKAATDEHGNAVPAHLAETKKRMRFVEVIGKLQKLPPVVAENYDMWIRVGLALHAFGSEGEIFNHWVMFSSRCRVKFDLHQCERQWAYFGRRPDCHNWRRGYNYIMRALPRQLQGAQNVTPGGTGM
jgi:hypothetical protein